MYVIGRSRDRAAVLEEVEEAISFKLTGVGRGPRMGQGWAGPLEPRLALLTNPCLHQPLSPPAPVSTSPCLHQPQATAAQP